VINSTNNLKRAGAFSLFAMAACYLFTKQLLPQHEAG
jgi:hypothetical protein